MVAAKSKTPRPALITLCVLMAALLTGSSAQAGEMLRMNDKEMRLRMLLKAMDANTDGQVSKEEYVKYYADTYDRIDMERKGILTYEEMEKSMEQLHMLEAM